MNKRTCSRPANEVWKISYVEMEILSLLSNHPTRRISFDAMAVRIGYDRRSLISAMQRLCHNGLVRIAEPGRGCIPHRYEV